MGQGLIHQCEKGKPPAGVFVCYKDIFEEPHRLKTKIKINEFLIRFLQRDFFSKHLLCKRRGRWDKFWYTSVRRGSLPLV